MKFRVEIDALNAIYEQQLKTNELLQQVVGSKLPEAKPKAKGK